MKAATRRLALWRSDLVDGVCAVPEECVAFLSDKANISVVLEHRERGRTATRPVFDATLRQDVEWQLTGLAWPLDLHPGVLVTVAWPVGRAEVLVRTTALDEPINVDGINYFHEYDPKVVTREFEPGPSNRGRVLAVVRKQGRVFADGSAVLAEAGLAAQTGLGRGAKAAFLLRNAVDQLIREGYLTRVEGSVESSGYPGYPAVAGQKPVGMLFYAPLVEPADPDDDEASERRDHLVNGFVRKLPPGAHASERQVTLHEQVDGKPLEPGYTFVKKHHRGTSS